MADKEKKNLEKGEGDLEEKDCPLSREGWIMFLGDKINGHYRTNSVFVMTICFACALAGLSGIVAFNIAEMDIKYIHVLSIFVIVSIAIALIVRHLETKRVKTIERIRDGIILKEEGFKTYDEIRDQCKNAGVILTKNKNLLDKTDMDNANKELEDGEEDLEKRDIKESLDRIENEMEKGKKFTIWSVFGGFFIATGLGVIGFSIRHDPIATVSGVCMLVVGGVILSICFIKFKRI